ncbi:MAG: J domain-containing protein [Lacibacter sp.]
MYSILKDYYHILNLPETASRDEIKKAFRKLAFQFHPDKNPLDPYAEAHFREIQEACEVLLHPHKREQYLQQRRAMKAKGYRFREPANGPASILIQCLELSKQIAFMDVHRMDFKGIANRITLLLNREVVEQLLEFNESEVNRSIITLMLKTIEPLPLAECTRVCNLLLQLAATDDRMTEQIDQILKRKKQQEQWRSYRIILALLTVLVLCLLIYFAGNR